MQYLEFGHRCYIRYGMVGISWNLRFHNGTPDNVITGVIMWSHSESSPDSWLLTPDNWLSSSEHPPRFAPWQIQNPDQCGSWFCPPKLKRWRSNAKRMARWPTTLRRRMARPPTPTPKRMARLPTPTGVVDGIFCHFFSLSGACTSCSPTSYLLHVS